MKKIMLLLPLLLLLITSTIVTNTDPLITELQNCREKLSSDIRTVQNLFTDFSIPQGTGEELYTLFTSEETVNDAATVIQKAMDRISYCTQRAHTKDNLCNQLENIRQEFSKINEAYDLLTLELERVRNKKFSRIDRLKKARHAFNQGLRSKLTNNTIDPEMASKPVSKTDQK